MSVQGQSSLPTPSKAVRLRFAYEGNDVRLEGQQPLEMVVPPTDALSGYEGEQGFWVEVRTAQDEVLHRQVMRDPLRQDVEVFSPDPTQSIVRAPVEQPSGAFTVLIPDIDEADHVALMSSAERGKAPEMVARSPATELARFSLRSVSEGGEA
jgi:hypothetical protein